MQIIPNKLLLYCISLCLLFYSCQGVNATKTRILKQDGIWLVEEVFHQTSTDELPGTVQFFAGGTGLYTTSDNDQFEFDWSLEDPSFDNDRELDLDFSGFSNDPFIDAWDDIISATISTSTSNLMVAGTGSTEFVFSRP